VKQLAGSCVIVGMGRSICKRGDPEKKTPLQLMVEAAGLAMKEAGINRTQIGAVFTGRMPRTYCSLQYNQAVLNELKIVPTFSSEVTSHGAGALGTIEMAVLAVQSGMIDYALCVCGEASPLWIEMVEGSANWEGDLQFEAPYGATTPSLYAQCAQRYMHEYGITPEQLAKVCVENRRWALDHPQAAMHKRGPITIDDVLNSKMIASPMRMLECATWFPGGIGSAAIVTRANLAKASPGKPTYIAGFGQCSTHEWIGERMGFWGVEPVTDGPNLVRTGASVAARQAYAMSGFNPKDVDIVQTSAPFSFLNVLILEELGFCGVGEGGRFVESGGVDYDGGLPFNTTGGYLSFGQSGQGLYLLKEVMDQIKGCPEGRPVPGVEVGLVHGHGGPNACHSVMLVTGEPLN